mmetsp:Transcript_9015/g.22596  ORF Transcript_9015/g.22596 Transcript_9015/m.22596 type:complete len:510 (-) Transcript_9015:36-1565(-)
MLRGDPRALPVLARVRHLPHREPVVAQAVRRVLLAARRVRHGGALALGRAVRVVRHGDGGAPVHPRVRGVRVGGAALLHPVPPARAAVGRRGARAAQGRGAQGRPAHRRGQGVRGHVDAPRPVPHEHLHGRAPGRLRPQRPELGVPHVRLGQHGQGRVRVVAGAHEAPGAVLLSHAHRPRAGLLPDLGAAGLRQAGVPGALPALGAHPAARAGLPRAVVRGPPVRAAHHGAAAAGVLRGARGGGGGALHGGDGARAQRGERRHVGHVPLPRRVLHGERPAVQRRVPGARGVARLARGGDLRHAQGSGGADAQRVPAAGPRRPGRLLPAHRDGEDGQLPGPGGVGAPRPQLAVRRLLLRPPGLVVARERAPHAAGADLRHGAAHLRGGPRHGAGVCGGRHGGARHPRPAHPAHAARGRRVRAARGVPVRHGVLPQLPRHHHHPGVVRSRRRQEGAVRQAGAGHDGGRAPGVVLPAPRGVPQGGGGGRQRVGASGVQRQTRRAKWQRGRQR